MKIGILTYHRTHNYGGCLQALATRTILQHLGYEACYVDYWPAYHAAEYKIFNKQKYAALTWKGKMRYILNYCMTYYSRKKRHDNFEAYHQQFTYPYCKPLTESYDAIVYGSDQIWRKQKVINTYNPIYFGINDFKANKHIAFSASMGIIPEDTKDKNIIKNYLTGLDSIAVRESNLLEFVQSLGFIHSAKTSDPTLILSDYEWDEIIPTKRIIKEKYLLVYALWGGVFNIESIRSYAKENKLKIVYLRGEALKNDTDTEFTTADPQTFISLIKHAEMVLSSSFHGLAFSIIYHKEFFVSFNSNAERAKSLLNDVGLSDRFINPKEEMPRNFTSIDYGKVEHLLQKLRMKSINYLKDSLK